MFGWPAWLTSGFSGNLALEMCFIFSFASSYVILFEPNKYLLLLLLVVVSIHLSDGCTQQMFPHFFLLMFPKPHKVLASY